MTVIWKAPRKSVWEERLEPLLERPGDWAVVFTCDTPEAAYVHCSNLRNGRLTLPEAPGIFQFAAQKSEDGKGEVFARYMESEVASA